MVLAAPKPAGCRGQRQALLPAPCPGRLHGQLPGLSVRCCARAGPAEHLPALPAPRQVGFGCGEERDPAPCPLTVSVLSLCTEAGADLQDACPPPLPENVAADVLTRQKTIRFQLTED